MGDGSFLLYMLPVFAVVLVIRHLRPGGIAHPLIPERLGASALTWRWGKLLVFLLYALVFVVPSLVD